MLTCKTNLNTTYCLIILDESKTFMHDMTDKFWEVMPWQIGAFLAVWQRDMSSIRLVVLMMWLTRAYNKHQRQIGTHVHHPKEETFPKGVKVIEIFGFHTWRKGWSAAIYGVDWHLQPPTPPPPLALETTSKLKRSKVTCWSTTKPMNRGRSNCTSSTIWVSLIFTQLLKYYLKPQNCQRWNDTFSA